MDHARPDDQKEDAEKERRQNVEEQGEDDGEPVAGLHEAEEGHLLADEQTDERSERDRDRSERGERKDEISYPPTESSHL